ncbi:MAG TPA: L-histidine N(alpha)-methyltransferase [Thermoanaerobaculia bacterium]|nr:L-histidine N(alpha)-methyltransferase [Thermoanaerobaculia bacterium]
MAILETTSRIQVTVANQTGQAARDRLELRESLLRSPREIPSRFFYDDHGSWLFERICELPEYYQTRTEHSLLRDIADRVAAISGADELVEIGSGAATKTRTLLDALARAGRLRLYVPVDVAQGTVRRVAEELAGEYPELAIHGLVADFNADLGTLPDGFHGGQAAARARAWFGTAAAAGYSVARSQPESGGGHRLVIFLGGTIGNLQPAEAHAFLVRRHREMAAGDHFLLGVDLVKPVARLEAAYNDAAGITAAFNRNILRNVNRLAGGDFDPLEFSHRAFYDPANRWIEMRLRSSARRRVELPQIELAFELAPGDEIRTEISVKYDRAAAEALLAGAGFEPVDWFTDAEELFGLCLARKG